MDPKVVWLAAALDDLDEIASYIAQDSVSYAAAVVRKIRNAARDLSRFPRMGPRVPEWDDDNLRQRIIYSYRLIYRINDQRIEILCVIHGARLLPQSIRRRS
jgi:plasmid stabilization system protein ParE